MSLEEIQRLANEYSTKGDLRMVQLGRKDIGNIIAALANQDEALALVIQDGDKSLIIAVLPARQRKINNEDIGNLGKIVLGSHIATHAQISFKKEAGSE